VPVALATSREFPSLSDDDRLVLDPLDAAGVQAECVVWDSARTDWQHYDAVVIRSCWDYYRRVDEFERWLALLERLGVAVWNPLALLRWNMDKHYLAGLAARGVPTVPTTWVTRNSDVTLAGIMRSAGWRDVVVKPTVSNNAVRTWRIRSDDVPSRAAEFTQLVAECDVMVQPFIAEVEREGEWSLVFFGGRFSHAIRKRPRDGDFRVQQEHGGSSEADEAPPALVAQAAAVLAQVSGPWLYARVDACEVDGRLLLMELEMLEPSLFLAQHPDGARRFADAIREVVGPSSIRRPGMRGRA
jgi:glutathione synthase/RimK-type ligase-like ATP-grasp enzyme